MGKGSCFSPFFFTAGTPREQSRVTLQQSRGFLSEERRPDPKTVDPAVETVDPSTLPTASRAHTTGQDSKSINSIIRRALMLRKRKLTLDKNGGNYANY